MIELSTLQFARFVVLIAASFFFKFHPAKVSCLTGARRPWYNQITSVDMLGDVTRNTVLKDFHYANGKFF